MTLYHANANSITSFGHGIVKRDGIGMSVDLSTTHHMKEIRLLNLTLTAHIKKFVW